ncbi:hypothetical protein AMAG_17126 [Allomyces macrogynus ATCC 38327]|uniref:Kinesin-like protein n=1 Tax=Allomyces macrogynus (strain ATCC 38327) TaxID=578462 RepID=A0A0L0TE68_ALLM3|nr:hypothetical protein AMAG_17126 [Allomyces macrogynus ATCC 38327]|eukprot:KNE72889.1 hypothetical protein AMAG_17126 [Allomyces macrogynus ATCC 38327]
MNNVYSLPRGQSPAPSVMSSSSAASSAKGSPPPTSPTSTLHLDQASAAPSHGGSVMGDESGRIKVFVRVRPVLAHEANEKDTPTVTTDPGASQITIFDNVKKPASFVFDHVFPPATDNRAVYAQVGKPLVEACLRGFNGTLIAYGQTGTGKTTTLSASDGVIPRALRQLFRAMARDQHRYVYKVRLSYMQIYQERIYDLLAPDMPDDLQDAPGLALREHPELGIFVEGLTEHAVRSINDVNAMLQLGQSRLIFAETKMNRHSSRSHAICFLTVERAPNRAFGLAASMSRTSFNSLSASSSVAGASAGLQQRSASPTSPVTATSPGSSSALRQPTALGSNLSPPTAGAPSSFFAPRPSIFYTPGEDDLDLEMDLDEDAHVAEDMFAGQDPDVVVRGRLTLCDLAGSERVKKTLATGQQLNEAKDINLSLLELGNVIQALAESKKHIPFRNATLTRLLQESLGGNCLTSLIVCVSPTRKDLSETKGTLLFGFRAMRIKTHARVNVEVDHEKLAKELEEALKRKESEWAAKEQQYRAELEQLRSRAQLHAPSPSPATPGVSAPPGLPPSSSGATAVPPADDDPMQTRYRALLDSFTTAAETLRDIAGQITSDILVADLTAAQALAQLRDTCPLPAQLAGKVEDPRPASPSRSRSTLPSSRSRSASPHRSAWGLGGIPHSALLTDLLDVYRPDLTSRAGAAESITDVVRHLRAADRDAQVQVLDRLGDLVPPNIARAWPRPAGAGTGGAMVFSAQLAQFRTLVQTHPADLQAGEVVDVLAGAGPHGKALERYPDSGHTNDLLPTDSTDPSAGFLATAAAVDDEEDSDLAILDAATRETARALQSAWAVLRHLQSHSALTRAVGIFERLLVQRELDRVAAELDGASEVVAQIERALGVTVGEGNGMRERLMAVLQAVEMGGGGERLRVRAGWRLREDEGDGEGRRAGDAGSDGVATVDDEDQMAVEKQRACGTECLIQ